MSGLTAGSPATKTYRLRLWGNIAQAGTVRVTAKLAGDELTEGTEGSTEKFVDVVFSTESRDTDGNVYTSDATGTDADEQDISDSSVAVDTDTHDPRDPDSREWNGLFPPFELDPSGDVSTLKPKVSWAKPSDFKAGTSTDTVVATITGPVEGINFYVAAKDTVKLYGIAKSAAKDIPLTSASVKQYNIPFRVIAIDSSKNIATGNKKTDKNITTTVTIAFNGGNYAYKGFPLTVSAWNKNNTSKPAAKTVKLNVTPNDSAPEWGTLYKYTYASGDSSSSSNSKTYTTSSYTTWQAWQDSSSEAYKGGENLELTSGVGSSRNYVLLTKNSKPVEVQYYFVDGVRQRYSLTESGYNTADFSSSLGDNNYAAWSTGSYGTEQRGKYWYAAIPNSFYVTVTDTSATADEDTSTGEIEYITAQVFTSIDKKAKPEIVTAVYPTAAEGSRGGSIPGTRYYVRAAAPFRIDTPKAPKDDGIVITVNQPSFDYLGNNTVSGSVYISGTLQETSKESKNKIKLKVSNPTTKKNAQITVIVAGKTVPEFPKLADFTFDTSVLNEETESDAWFTNHGYDDTRKKLITKRVTAGKTPKAKFKASGSKTITYKLGLYDSSGNVDGYTAFHHARANFTGDAELWDYMYGYIITHSKYSQYGETFNSELEANLAAHNLSFDTKKGSVVQLVSGTATTPTLNDAGTQFASLDLAITAVNDVGSAQAWAELAITGDKPKVADKTVSVYGSVQKGDVFTFKLLGGKTIAESVRAEGGAINVRSYTASDSDTKTLSDWGLELVNYDSMDILVSDEVTFEAGATIPGYDPAKHKIVNTGDYEDLSSAITSATTTDEETGDETTTYTAGDYGVTLLSGDTWIRSKDVSYINYGLIQVIDPAALAKVITDAASGDSKGKALKKLEKGSKVSLILDNLGAIGKGKITVALLSNITSAGDPANYNKAANNGTLPANNGLTFNKAAPESTRLTGTAGYAPESDTDSEAEETESVTIGTPRTLANITAEQNAFLAENGYTVIAVLPEISANVDEQHDIDAELDEDSPEGAKLVYIPFPKNAQETEDDRIADFYDSEGKTIDKVPAQKSITVSPWLRKGVTYEPVIAVKNAGLTF